MKDKEKDKMLKEMYENADECLREEGRKQREQEILKIIEDMQTRIRIHSDARGDLEELKKKIKGDGK